MERSSSEGEQCAYHPRGNVYAFRRVPRSVEFRELWIYITDSKVLPGSEIRGEEDLAGQLLERGAA